jgi:hypothetical protein
MKRVLTATAVAIAFLLGVAGCNDYGNTFQNNTGAFLTALSPSQVSAGAPGFQIQVVGSGFVKQTKVQWNGKNLATTVNLDSNNNVLSVTAMVDASLVAKTGTASVNTINPASGAGNNGLSNAIAFIINPPPNPRPVLVSLNPTSTMVGGPQLTLTITGQSDPTMNIGFLPTSDPSGGSIVQWNANATITTLATTSITSTTITATIPASLLATVGPASVTVSNPPSPAPVGCIVNCNGGGGGGSSSPLTFSVCPTSQACSLAAAKTGAASAQAVVEETPAVSLDGRYVAYTALQDQHAQVFLRDTCEGAPSGCQPRTTLLSATADGVAANDDSRAPSISADARYIAFSSAATNLVSSSPAGRQIYLQDTCAGADSSCKPSTQLLSTDASGALVGTENILPSVSSSGRFIAFLSVTPSHAVGKNSASSGTTSAVDAANALNSGYRQVFVRDTCLGASNCTPRTIRISMQPGDASSAKPAGPAISGNGNDVGVSGANSATIFPRSIAVDDRVFLAVTKDQH